MLEVAPPAAPPSAGLPVRVGVDPGGRTTGVCARLRDDVVAALLIERIGSEVIPPPGYVRQVAEEVRVLVAQLTGLGWVPSVVVEDVRPPTPQLGMSNPGGLLGAALVLGALLEAFPSAILVPPGGHGSQLLASYPTALRAPSERAGTGKRRHARSAYDVAGAAQARLAHRRPAPR